MSPERVSGLNYSFNADIWGVGILAFECSAGRSPYAAKGTFELLDAIVDGDAPSLPQVPYIYTTPKSCIYTTTGSFIFGCRLCLLTLAY